VNGRVLLVGFGRRGRDWHGALASRRGTECAGAVDPDPDVLAHAERLGLAAFKTLDDALDATDAAAVIVCSPPALHAAQAVACLDSGRRVLVEKPLALSLADATAVADASDRAGLPAVVGHNFRHRSVERAIRAALDSRAIGELRTVHMSSARPAGPPDGDHRPLWDLAVHHFDLLRLRLGGVPDSVEARVARSEGSVTYTARLEWRRASADYWLHEGASVYHNAEWLEGSHGAVRALDGRAWLVSTRRRPRRLRAPRGPGPEQVLLDALLEGDARAFDARESLGTVAVVEAAVRSIETGAPVRPGDLARAAT
jgi:predicted dehydrogenase